MNWISGVGSITTAIVLAACSLVPSPTATQPQPRARIVDTACDWAKPIYPSCSDVVSDATARQIINHNEAGAAHCGWKPPAGARCPKAAEK